jgi:uncharacterized protein YjiK
MVTTWNILGISILGLLVGATGAISQSNSQLELELTDGSPWFGRGEEELSGLTFDSDGKTLLGVADSDDNRSIYQIVIKDNHFELTPKVTFDKLPGYASYRQSLSKVTQLLEKDRRHDFEGIARCGSTYYIIDERVRKVIEVRNGKFREFPLHLSTLTNLWSGEANAGFEGIAVNCDDQLLYLAKEREPRLLITVNLKSGDLISYSSKLPRSARDNQRVIDFKTGRGLMKVNEDISDLFFVDGALYVLERYTREIVKLDPKTLKELKRVSYFFSEFGLYQTALPFGLAEGLAIAGNRIYVAIDHNHESLSRKATEKFGVSGERGSIFVFKRPEGF